MAPDEGEPLATLSAENDRLRQEKDQLRAEVEHLVEAQRASEAILSRYANLYDHAPLPLLTLDNLGLIEDLNLTAAGLLAGDGEERSTLVGRRLRHFVVDADYGVLAEHLRRCQTATAPVSCELRLRRQSGQALVVALWSHRPRADVRSYTSALVDLTETHKKSLEIERLIEAERAARTASEAKDQFIATLSHELRTPLTPVLAAVSALAGRDDVEPHLRSIYEMIRRNVKTEARLIDDLLDVSRIARGKMHLELERVDVHALASEALAMVRAEATSKGITLMEGLQAEWHWSFADPTRIRQVVWNLLRNAIKFTPDNGRIELRSWNRDGRLAIEVSDTGSGFDEEAGPRLFRAFEQDKDVPQRFGGLGLGLAICKGVMELHGGTIAGTSLGRHLGSRFVIELGTMPAPSLAVAAAAREANPSNYRMREAPPALTIQRDPPEAPRPASRPRSTPRHREQSSNDVRLCILLVEDDVDSREMLRDLLGEAGYEVRVARTTREALAEKLDAIDLVLSDIGLPDGSGLDLMRALRVRAGIKGIALSGYGTQADIRASREAGFTAHVTKPFEIEGLLEVIEEVAATGRA